MITAAMGWVGTVGSISAYLLLSRGRWQATSLRYSALNGLAGILAGTASAVYGAWPSAASNLLWACIALQAAITTLRARRGHGAAPVESPAPGDLRGIGPCIDPEVALARWCSESHRTSV